LGQQLESAFGITTGDHTGFLGGIFLDHPSAWDSSLDVKPILAFKYFTPTTLMILGTLDTYERHGFLEPLEVETLEITRPIEYGLQWKEADHWFLSDLFLNWQQINTPGNPEIFDYGGVSTFPFNANLDFQLQFHGYHQGGKLFYVGVVNNYVLAMGGEVHDSLVFLGESSLSVFGMLSGNLQGPFLQVTQSQWGEGLYLKGSVTPWNLVELYGMVWAGWNFFSWEGDANYNSQGLDGYYRSDRTYQELGLKKVIAEDGEASLEAEIRSDWIDRLWACSGRLLAKISFGADVPIKIKENANEP
jgi:hypothetical protein